mgnify:CR=1 FL=1
MSDLTDRLRCFDRQTCTEAAERIETLEAELAAMRAGGEPVAAPMVGEMALIAKALQRVGITNVLNHGAASCVFSQGCAGVSQGHLLAYTREIALQCAAALYTHPQPAAQDAERWMELGQAIEQACMTLPEGVEVAMSFEQDAWKVKWFDENGNEHDTESHESGVASVMNDAIDTAIAAQGENKNMSERAFHTTGYITPAQPDTHPTTGEPIGTNAQEATAWKQAKENLMGVNHIHIARAIEHAHGIKGGQHDL